MATVVGLERCSTCGGRGCQCLYDILDPSGFVWATIRNFSRPTSRRGPIVLGDDELEELHCEGLAILHKLAGDYIPRKEGYAQDGRFSGYAAQLLPRKLGDAWHRLHAEHMLITEPSGARRWRYGEKAVSLEAMLADDPDCSDLLADRRRDADLKSRLHRVLYDEWCREVKVIVEVGELLSEGASEADVAVMLGLTPHQVAEAVARIAPVIAKLQAGE